MRIFLLVVALAHAAYCGNVGARSSNLLAPADVTYVDGSYHAGLTAGPLAYSAQPVYQSSLAAAPSIAVASQQVVAPVAYAAQATKYAAVPTVQHVPGVADVPVTRIDAQPAVIQKTVDVARPAVKTQRYEVRRPAIQKQFYDIEERVVVRPAGSAVVELDEPLSRTQKGPSVIRPTGEAVAVSSSAVAVPAAPAVATVSPAPVDLPSIDINLARSSLAAAPQVAVPSVQSVAAPSVGIARSSFAAAAPTVEVRASLATPAPAPALSSIGYARTAVAAPAPPPSSIATAGYARSTFVAASPAPPPSSIATAGYARSTFVAASPAPPPSVEYRPAPAPVPAISSIGYVRNTVAAPAPPPAPISSVGYARSTFTVAPPAPPSSVEYRPAPASIQSVSYPSPFAAQTVGISSVPVKTVSVSAPIQTATISGVSSISSGISGISAVSAGPSEISVSTPAPEYQQQIVQSTPTPQLSDDSVSIDSADFGLARSSGLARSYQGQQTFVASAPAPPPAPVQETIFRSELPPRRFVGQPAQAARNSLIVNYPNPVDLIPQSRFRSSSVYSEGSQQSEINHENQQRLLQLLTARGEVSEVGFGRSGPASYPIDAGQVRARVLSATPAPAYAAPTDERVNTRRVVVSRPIETLQEVEVAQPVTKYERVRVDQPAVVKSASQDIVRVPTSVPVYGKTLAPIAEAPVAAYSADWK